MGLGNVCGMDNLLTSMAANAARAERQGQWISCALRRYPRHSSSQMLAARRTRCYAVQIAAHDR